MKKIFKKISFAVLCAFVLLQSCETTELDLTTNPNALSPEQASPDFLLNAIQEDFARAIESLGETAGEVVRIDYMNGRDYQNAYTPTTFDDVWEDIYTEVFTDINAMIPIAEASNLTHHIGIGQFIKAYSITTLVDMFGDVPYSEANLGSENFNPKVDSGASIYDAALVLLDEAIVNFKSTAAANPQNDLFFNNDYDKWVKAANTLKMRLYLQRRLVDASAVASFNSIVASGDYITSNADNMVFKWGTNEVQPDTRHPKYSRNYTPTGGNMYTSNWLMNYMDENNDPRTRYYFYRQNSATPGNGGTPVNEETLVCSLQSAPAHYSGFPFCALQNGFWGRDHGNDEGAPPDGFLKTLYGVYPIGGKFDDDTFKGQVQGDGAGGNGVTPILLASSVDFWQAELALLNNNTADAKTELLSGVEKSINYVTSFGSLDTSADLSFAPNATSITNFVDAVGAKFDAASTDGKWDIVGEQFFTSLFGNGLDGYNFYRRTGYPHTLQPNLEPNPGNFIRSFIYPANFVNNNSSVDQKTDQNTQVFWDNNPSSPSFPIAN